MQCVTFPAELVDFMGGGGGGGGGGGVLVLMEVGL